MNRTTPPEGGITVSLVSHGQAELCAALLSDLERLAPPRVQRVIVTLNLPETLPSNPGLPFELDIVRNVQPQGFADNHNRAFERVQTPYFAVLNPDLRFEQDVFMPLADTLQDSSIGVASPVVYESDGRPADHARSLVTPGQVLRRKLRLDGERGPLAAPDWIAGMFMMFRSEVFRALGGFDTRFFLYCEDVDLCARLRLKGMRLAVVPQARVLHYAQRASHRKLRPLLLHLSSLIRFWSSPVYRDYRALLELERAGRT